MPSSLVSKIRTNPLLDRTAGRPGCQSGLLLRTEILAPQDVVVMLGKPMRLIAHVLQEAQRRGVPAQPQRLRIARAVDLFLALGQRDQSGRLDAEQAEGVE